MSTQEKTVVSLSKSYLISLHVQTYETMLELCNCCLYTSNFLNQAAIILFTKTV